MAGTGFNYIREIMQMNLPEESTPEALKEYEREEKAKKFHYIGLTPYKPFDHNCKVLIMPPGMAGVIAVNKDELRPIHASVNDVVQHCGRLFVYTNTGIWSQFVPGPCTDYDGPNPYKKTIYTSTSTVYDSPLAEAVRENLKKSLDKAGILGPCELERVSDTEIVAKYDVKYIGETFTDVRKYHDNRVVWLHHPIRVYNQVRHEANIGEAVKWDDLIYVWNGSQWVEFPKPEKVAMEWSKTNKEEKGAMEYHKIPYGFMKIKNVVFNYPATIVMWEDGSKTVVKCGENEEFDPEKGLTMAIAKKAFGNQGNYYNQIRKWLPKDEPVPTVHVDGGSIQDTIRRVNDHISNVSKSIYVENCKRRLAWIQDLIVDMTYKGAKKEELVRAIRHSKDLIDGVKGRGDTDIKKSAEIYGIDELEAKYQPKK